MSERLKLAIRRQRDVQKSRDIAWMVFAALVPIILLAALGLLLPLVSPEPRISFGQLISGVVAIFAAGIAWQVFREARRLGRLLRDPQMLMSLERDSDEMRGLHWSVLNPFSGWRS